MIALKETGKNLADLTRLYEIICIKLILIYPQLNMIIFYNLVKLLNLVNIYFKN